MNNYTTESEFVGSGKTGNRKHLYIWALAFYLLIVPLDAIKLFDSFSFMRILVLLPMVLVLPQIKNQGLKLNKNGALLFIYVAIILFSVVYSIDSSFSRERATSILLNAGVVIVLSMFQIDRGEYGLLKKACLLSSWLAALLMIGSSINNVSVTGRISISNGASTQDSNYVCGYLLYAAAFYANEILNQRSKIKNTITLLFFAVLIFMTGSRGGLLAFIFTVLIVFLIGAAKRRNRIRTTVTIAFMVILFILISPYIIQFLPQTVADRFSLSAVMTDRGTGRTVLWGNIIQAFKEATIFRQLFGYGIGMSTSFTWNNLLAHNLWLEYLIGIGLIGTLIALIFYARLSVLCWKYNENVILGTLMGYMMMSMSLSFMAYKPIWNITLMILLLERVRDDEENVGA